MRSKGPKDLLSLASDLSTAEIYRMKAKLQWSGWQKGRGRIQSFGTMRFSQRGGIPLSHETEASDKTWKALEEKGIAAWNDSDGPGRWMVTPLGRRVLTLRLHAGSLASERP